MAVAIVERTEARRLGPAKRLWIIHDPECQFLAAARQVHIVHEAVIQTPEGFTAKVCAFCTPKLGGIIVNEEVVKVKEQPEPKRQYAKRLPGLSISVLNVYGTNREMKNWGKEAKCLNQSTANYDVWYHGNNGTVEGRAICMTCPVRGDCLDYAIVHHERFGMWGGCTPRERWQIRELRRKAGWEPGSNVATTRLVAFGTGALIESKPDSWEGDRVPEVRAEGSMRGTSTDGRTSGPDTVVHGDWGSAWSRGNEPLDSLYWPEWETAEGSDEGDYGSAWGGSGLG